MWKEQPCVLVDTEATTAQDTKITWLSLEEDLGSNGAFSNPVQSNRIKATQSI